MTITKRGKSTQVPSNIEDDLRIKGQRRSIVEALSMPGLSDIDVEFPRSRKLARSADVS